MSDELETRIEYGHVLPEPFGWVQEARGIKYASHQRTVHFRVDEPVAIDHWTYADHRHPVAGCEVCEQLAAHGHRPVTTREDVESRLVSGVAGNPDKDGDE